MKRTSDYSQKWNPILFDDFTVKLYSFCKKPINPYAKEDYNYPTSLLDNNKNYLFADTKNNE